MTAMVELEPWHHGLFYHGTPILVNLDRSPEIAYIAYMKTLVKMDL